MDLPGGKRILIINMRAQHITFNKAIKTVKIVKNKKTKRKRRNFTFKILYNLNCFKGFVKSYMLGSYIYYKNYFEDVDT